MHMQSYFYETYAYIVISVDLYPCMYVALVTSLGMWHKTMVYFYGLVYTDTITTYTFKNFIYLEKINV